MPARRVRYRKYSDEDKERVKMLYCSGLSMAEVSRRTKVPESTIKEWINKIDDDNLTELRDQKKREFAEKAWDTITKAHDLLNRQLDDAIERQEAIDNAMDAILNAGEDINPEDMRSLISELKRLKRPDYRELTTAIGTLYDKQALVAGEATWGGKIDSDKPIKVEFIGELEEWAK